MCLAKGTHQKVVLYLVTRGQRFREYDTWMPIPVKNRQNRSEMKSRDLHRVIEVLNDQSNQILSALQFADMIQGRKHVDSLKHSEKVSAKQQRVTG